MKGRWGVAIVALLCWGLPVLAYAVAPLVLPTHNANGQCEGIGWGCTLTPADGLRFLVFMSAPVWVFGGAIAMILVVWLRQRKSKRAV